METKAFQELLLSKGFETFLTSIYSFSIDPKRWVYILVSFIPPTPEILKLCADNGFIVTKENMNISEDMGENGGEVEYHIRRIENEYVEDVKFKIFEKDDKQYIERLVYPRFRSEISEGVLPDIKHIEVLEDSPDLMKLKKALRAAGEYLRKGHLKK